MATLGKLLFLVLTLVILGVGACSQTEEAEQKQPTIEELLQSAEQGDADAQHNLGSMYRKGEGVPQDSKEAVKWYRKAADQGLANAQGKLGATYYCGQGVPKDYIIAYMWRNLAASNSTDKDVREVSGEARDELEKR